MKKRPQSKLAIFLILSLALTVLCAGALTLSLMPDTQIALATDASFTQVFPTTDYFQSANPSKVSANRSYLLIYDDVADKLFVRGGGSTQTSVYSTDFENVQNVFAIGSVAFLNCGSGCYTLDLTDSSATWQARTLPTPTNITYFNSDGTYLYAHSAFGTVSVYDQNLDIAFDADNVQDYDFAGQSTVVTGEGSTLYVFSIDGTGKQFFTTYNLLDGTKTSKVYTKGVLIKAYVGDAIYALKTFDDTNYIVCIDKQSGEELFSTEISPDYFFAYGERLFTVSQNSVTVYTLAEDKKSLRLDSSITMSGSDLGHFDAPSDVIKDGDKLVVADSKNNRLSIIESGEMSCVYFENSPQKVCKGQNDYYVAFANGVSKIASGKITATYDIEGVLDVTYLDKLYVLTTDGVYILLGDGAVKLCSSYGAKRITSAKDGTNVYLLCNEQVITLNQSGKQLPTLAQDDFTDAVDFAVDYAGKITVAFKDGYKQYLGENKDEFTLVSSSIGATLTSVYLDENSLYFSTEECFIGKCSVDATSKLSFININSFAPTAKDAIAFAKAKDGALTYSLDGRVENTALATGDVYMIYVGRAVNEAGDLKYAYCGRKIAIIDQNDFDILQPSTLNGDYVTKTPTTLYTSPYCEDGKIELNGGVVVTRQNDCADFDDGKWIAVQYDDNTYYALSSDFEEYVVVIPEKDKVYGRANADRAGGIVNVYALADANSDVIAQIVDGSKVEVLETLDDFYLVSFDGKVGYIRKSELKIDGLTTVQIVAIVLSIVVALAGSAIFASIYITRKNAENKKNEDKPQKRF